MGISQITHKARTGALIALIFVAPLKGITKTAVKSDVFEKSIPELVENTKVTSFDNMAIASISDGPKKHKLSKSCKRAAKSKPGVRLNKPKKIHRINDKTAMDNIIDGIANLFKTNKRVPNTDKNKNITNQGMDTFRITVNKNLKREKNPQQIDIDFQKQVNKDMSFISENSENVAPKTPSTDIYYINTEGCPTINY